MIFDEYAAYTARAKKEYGEQTVVLMEVGSFWELYDCNQRSGANMPEVCGLLNIQLSRKNKAVQEISRTNPMMAGFPSHALERFLPILLESNHTVVLVGQVTPPPNPKRDVVQVISRGTMLNEVEALNANSNATVYIEGKQGNYNIGVAIVDIATGATTLYETYSKKRDENFIFDELNRIYLISKPQEISFIGSPADLTVEQIATNSKIPYKSIKIYDMLNLYDKSVHKPEYQNEMLKISYKISSFLTPIEHIDAEKRPLAVIAFTYLLQFLYKHSKFLVEKLQYPDYLEEHKYLNLGYNTLEQLEIEALCKQLNRCKTAPGKRQFDRLVKNPIIIANELQERYAKVDLFRSMGRDRIQEIRSDHLASIYDLDRINRRIINKKLNPQEITLLYRSVESVMQLGLVQEHTAKIKLYLDTVFDVEACSKFNMSDEITESLFKSCDEISDITTNIEQNQNFITSLAARLNSQFKSFFKLEQTDRDGYYLSITTKRYQEIKKELNEFLDTYHDKICSISNTTSYTKLVTESLKENSNRLFRLRSQVAKLIKSLYLAELDRMQEAISESICCTAKAVADYDAFMTAALNSLEFNYCRPSLKDAPDGSMFSIKQIRHPLVERIGTDSMYVANDIYLDRTDQQGILLYGLNAAGKSTLMKAVGLSIVLAQAGMYVPCAEMELAPYRNLFSRMSKNDDIQRGQSTFMVEMSELRNILKRADSYSMVIGDEICSGTESTSALAIVAAAIQSLAEANTNFLFATHLHDLPKLSIPSQIKEYHLHVEYNSDTQQLVYYRDLRPGQGSALYGIEVCRALKMDERFLSRAIQIRNSLTPSTPTLPEQSPYNSNMYVSKCDLCGAGAAKEVHHIKFQSKADAAGFIGHTFVHSKENLVGLCESCHHKIHANQILVTGKVATSSGIALKQEQVEKRDHDEFKQLVISMRKNKTSWVKIQQSLLEQHQSQISIYKLKKMVSLS